MLYFDICYTNILYYPTKIQRVTSSHYMLCTPDCLYICIIFMAAAGRGGGVGAWVGVAEAAVSTLASTAAAAGSLFEETTPRGSAAVAAVATAVEVAVTVGEGKSMALEP